MQGTAFQGLGSVLAAWRRASIHVLASVVRACKEGRLHLMTTVASFDGRKGIRTLSSKTKHVNG